MCVGAFVDEWVGRCLSVNRISTGARIMNFELSWPGNREWDFVLEGCDFEIRLRSLKNLRRSERSGHASANQTVEDGVRRCYRKLLAL